MIGNIYVLCAVIACAGFNVTSDLRVRNNDVLQSLVVYTFSCFLFALILHTLRWYNKVAGQNGLPVSFFPSVDILWYLVLMGLFAFVANFGVTTAYKYELSAQSIMTMLMLVPVVAMFIRSMLVGGMLTREQMAGYGFCAVGVWLVTRSSVS